MFTHVLAKETYVRETKLIAYFLQGHIRVNEQVLDLLLAYIVDDAECRLAAMFLAYIGQVLGRYHQLLGIPLRITAYHVLFLQQFDEIAEHLIRLRIHG